MQLLSESGPVFGQPEVGLWVYLFLALPLLLGGAAAYKMFSTKELSEKLLYALGLFFTLLFVPLPWLFAYSNTGLRVEFDKDNGIVRISDELASEPFELPFSGFSSYFSRVESQTDSDGHTSYTYFLYLTSKKTYAILLSRSGNENFLLSRKKALAALPLPVAEGLSGYLINSVKQGISIVPAPRSLCQADFRFVQSEIQEGSCHLSWPVRMHPAFYIGLGLPLLIIFFIAYRIHYTNAGWGLWSAGLISVLILVAFSYVLLRSWNARQHLKLSEDTISAWIASPLLGRSLDREVPLAQLRFASAVIASDPNVSLSDTNPVEGSLNPIAIFQKAVSQKSLVFSMDGLPIREQLLLLETLLQPAQW